MSQASETSTGTSSCRWCEPRALHVGFMHAISASQISSWPRPIDCHAVAHHALEAANENNNNINHAGGGSGGGGASSVAGSDYAAVAGCPLSLQRTSSMSTSNPYQLHGFYCSSEGTPGTPVSKIRSVAGGGGSSGNGPHFPSSIPAAAAVNTPSRTEDAAGSVSTTAAASPVAAGPLPANTFSSATSVATTSFTSPASVSFDQSAFNLESATAAVHASPEEAASLAGLTEDTFQRGFAHFESALKDNDLADDRHLRRMMELLLPPGVFLHDHDIPRFSAGSGGPAAVVFQDGTSRSSMHFTGNPLGMNAASAAGLGAIPPAFLGQQAPAGGQQGAAAASRSPLRWNWTVLRLAQNQFLATFITQTSFEEYQSLGFAIHLDSDSYETALRQARWMVAAGAIRLLVAAPDDSGSGGGTTSSASMKIHSEFVDQVVNEKWRNTKTGQQRWIHFMNAMKRYTLPRPETFWQVAASVVPLGNMPSQVQASPDLRLLTTTRPFSSDEIVDQQQQQQQQQQQEKDQNEEEKEEKQEEEHQQKQQNQEDMDESDRQKGISRDAEGSDNLLRLRSDDGGDANNSSFGTTATTATTTQHHHQKASATTPSSAAAGTSSPSFNPYRIRYIAPSVFPPSLSQSHVKPLPPPRYIFGFKDAICDILLKGYMIQIGAGTAGTPTIVWQAWHNFFHATLFSLMPTLEDEAPLSIWHFPPLVDGLVPGSWFTCAPKSVKSKWDVALRVHRFLVDKQKEDIGLFRPAASAALSSIEESPALSLLFQAVVPLMKLADEGGGGDTSALSSSSSATPTTTTTTASAAAAAAAAAASAGSTSSANQTQQTLSGGLMHAATARGAQSQSAILSSTTSGGVAANEKDDAATTTGSVKDQQHQQQKENSSNHNERREWTEPNLLLCETIHNWRCYIMRQVEELEFRISRLFFCASRLQGQLHQQQQQRNSAATGLASRPSGAGMSPAGSGMAPTGSGMLEEMTSATFVRCTCDRCQEDTEVILARSDPFVSRLIHPIAKQLLRLLKRLAPVQQNRQVF